MKLTFLGGADEVGASCTLVEIAGKRLLIDAGIRIAPKSSRDLQASQLPDLQPISEIGGVDFILVTHAHTDHTGALPLVVGQFPDVPVYMTRPTEALVRVLQKDAQRIMAANYEAENELPLFDEVAVDKLLSAIQIIEFNQPLKLGEGLQVTYHVSGHIAGAGLLVIESVEGNLVMSGDVSKSPQRTVESIKVPRVKADILVLESTYGGRLHANREAEERRIIESLNRVIERGGKVLIPAFALGRAQEVLQIILAYRDQFSAPVYVDGMVRSVCDAYSIFQDLLPAQTVKRARLEHLFFRENIKPIQSIQQRNELVYNNTPMVIVASSGMLTGGASQFYAQHLAPVAENAIFLTGYQDEEAPGKALQRLVKEHNPEEETRIRLGKESVTVRCEIGSYSLSAHADEDELVSIARALGAKEVLLVHGDASARHSLATALRQRQIITHTPQTGTVREYQFAKKQWKVGGNISAGKEINPVNIVELWEKLKQDAGNYFSARELALTWWGDSDREKEMLHILRQAEPIYFVPDWRNKTTFLVRPQQDVLRTLQQREIMLNHPDIVNKLIVLRTTENLIRVGVVKNAHVSGFEAEVEGTKTTNYEADSLLWVIGTWEGYQPLYDKPAKGEVLSKRAQLSALRRDAMMYAEDILPFERRKALADKNAIVYPPDLLPNPLPQEINSTLALTAIVITLAEDFAVREANGLRLNTAIQTNAVLEMNEARNLAIHLFPKEANLRRVGIEVADNRLVLVFDYPLVAEVLYQDIIQRLAQQSGWQVSVRQVTTQDALLAALLDLIPQVKLSKMPSYHMEQKLVILNMPIENAQAVQSAFLQRTGFTLQIGKTPDSAPTGTLSSSPPVRMEINKAYALIKSILEQKGLYRTSLKEDAIVLSFISPEVGNRYSAEIEQLEAETGYPIRISSQSNQQQILMIARQIIESAGGNIRKMGIYTEQNFVAVTLNNLLDEVTLSTLENNFEERTGFYFRFQ